MARSRTVATLPGHYARLTARCAPFALAMLAAPLTANAGNVWYGVGLEANKDFSGGSDDNASFGPGAGLRVPVGYAFSGRARFRADLSFHYARGEDTLAYPWSIDGQEVHFTDRDGHDAIFFAPGLMVGADGDLMGGRGFRPYIGASAGVLLAVSYHSNFDPSLNVLFVEGGDKAIDGGYINPHTRQPVIASDLRLGGHVPLVDGVVDLTIETGYSVAFVGEADLQRSGVEGATRSAYAWNAARLGVGVAFGL